MTAVGLVRLNLVSALSSVMSSVVVYVPCEVFVLVLCVMLAYGRLTFVFVCLGTY